MKPNRPDGAKSFGGGRVEGIRTPPTAPKALNESTHIGQDLCRQNQTAIQVQPQGLGVLVL